VTTGEASTDRMSNKLPPASVVKTEFNLQEKNIVKIAILYGK
jgi:hypothetical protein